MTFDTPYRQKRKAEDTKANISKDKSRSQNTVFSLDTEADHYARIIQHLRDDVAKTYPNEAMPTNWMIHCLSRSLYDSSMRGRPWEENAYRLLMHIAAFVETSEGQDQGYFDKKIQKSLFPELNYFSPKHAARFATFAILQLRKATSSSAVWHM